MVQQITWLLRSLSLLIFCHSFCDYLGVRKAANNSFETECVRSNSRWSKSEYALCSFVRQRHSIVLLFFIATTGSSFFLAHQHARTSAIAFRNEASIYFATPNLRLGEKQGKLESVDE